MVKEEKEGTIRRLLSHIPGRRARAPEEGKEDQGNSYEFEATIGPKGSSLGFTFDTVSQALGKIKKGMKARVMMIREPGSSIFTARIVFVEAEEGKKTGSGVST